MENTGTKNFREDELNPRLGYAMVIIEKLQNTCTGGVISYRRVLSIICYELLDWIELRTPLNEFGMFG